MTDLSPSIHQFQAQHNEHSRLTASALLEIQEGMDSADGRLRSLEIAIQNLQLSVSTETLEELPVKPAYRA